MDDKIRAIVERFWNDVAGLPWKDQIWVNNQALKEQTRQHYVNATTDDLIQITKNKEKTNAKERLDT